MPLTSQDVGPCNCSCDDDPPPCDGSICVALTSNCSWAIGQLSPSIEITDESTGLPAGGGATVLGAGCYALPPGTYTVTATRRGCVTKTWTGVVVECDRVDLAWEMACSTIRYRFTMTAAVCSPAPVMELFTGFTTATSLWGAFPMSSPGNAGSWEVYIDTTGIGGGAQRAYRLTHPNCTTVTGTVFTNGTGNCTSPNSALVNMNCTPQFKQTTVSIRGACHGEPIAGAGVSVTLGLAAHASGVTDADGNWTFTRAGNGTYGFTVTSPVAAYAGQSWSLTINRCDDADFTRTLAVALGHTCAEVPEPPMGLMAIQSATPSEAPEYPGLAAQAASLTKAAGRFIASGFATVDQAEYDRRRSICESCPLFDAAQVRCRSCGCSIAFKPWAKAESCPESKW